MRIPGVFVLSSRCICLLCCAVMCCVHRRLPWPSAWLLRLRECCRGWRAHQAAGSHATRYMGRAVGRGSWYHKVCMRAVCIQGAASAPACMCCLLKRCHHQLLSLTLLCRALSCCLHHTTQQVLKVERIQNSKLWRRYALRRNEVEEDRGAAGEHTD